MIVVNDYRGRSPVHDLRAMLHVVDGPCERKWGRRREWTLRHVSVKAAEEDIGDRVYTCQLCLPGEGTPLIRV